MSKDIGIWIDHKKAVIAAISDGKESLVHIDSGIEKRVRFGGGARTSVPYGPEDVVAGDKIDRRIDQELHRYYQKVLMELSGADHIYLFGRKEARIEMEKELKKSLGLASKFVKSEPADKMTDNQVMAKTRKFFETLQAH